MTLFVCFCASWYFTLLAVFVGWTSVVGILWGSVVWCLISLSGRSGFALSAVCVGSLVVLGFLPFGGSFVGGFSPPVGILLFKKLYWCTPQWLFWRVISYLMCHRNVSYYNKNCMSDFHINIVCVYLGIGKAPCLGCLYIFTTFFPCYNSSL